MLCCELVVNGCRGIQVIMFLNLIKTIFIIISFVFTYNQQIPKYAQQDDTTYKIYYKFEHSRNLATTYSRSIRNGLI